MIFEDMADFAAALPRTGGLAGLDLGTKTIGVAVSDGLRQVASPLSTIRRVKFTTDAAALLAIVADRGLAGLILGRAGATVWPLAGAVLLLAGALTVLGHAVGRGLAPVAGGEGEFLPLRGEGFDRLPLTFADGAQGGDVVRAVAAEDELAQLRQLLGDDALGQLGRGPDQDVARVVLDDGLPRSPARAPASIDMLQIVMRPSMERSRIAEPRYSST